MFTQMKISTNFRGALKFKVKSAFLCFQYYATFLHFEKSTTIRIKLKSYGSAKSHKQTVLEVKFCGNIIVSEPQTSVVNTAANVNCIETRVRPNRTNTR